MKENNFTTGRILMPLMKFALPVLFAFFLQSMYGAVDLMVVGKFAASTEQSAVATGSQILVTITNVIVNFAMGVTIYLGHLIGEGNSHKGGKVIGTGIILFGAISIALTALVPIFSPQLCRWMNAPADAFASTADYVKICGFGIIVITAYNLIGSVFRGIGDSKTPLMTVAIACVFNIFGDIVLVKNFGLGARGAAYATVGAQFISVVISFVVIAKRDLPFEFDKKYIKIDKTSMRKIVAFGLPMALQDLLVGLSFVIILAVANKFGAQVSAAVGVAEKVCAFIMLLPISLMQAISAFVAQNYGAGKYDRAIKAFRYAVEASIAFGVTMFLFAYFKGDLLAVIFSKDLTVVTYAFHYLKAYAIDCLFTCFLFCYIGFFNGIGKTAFVSAQGVIGAFAIRVPVCIFMSKWDAFADNVIYRIFHIGLSIPCSTIFQILLCTACFVIVCKKLKGKENEMLEKNKN